MKKEIIVENYKLVQTSFACPEQYDVFMEDGQKAGYLRLRNGKFRADAPTCGGETVYESQTKGDGAFEEKEREEQLKKAVIAIKNWWKLWLR